MREILCQEECQESPYFTTLGGDKVGMLTCTQAPEEFKWPSTDHQVDNPLNIFPDVQSGDFQA